MSLPVLDPVEQRVLGALLEKQRTVPASYPLTASALRTACNQTSSRDPVLDLDAEVVERTVRALKERGLARIVWADSGRRTLKYHQRLDEVLGLDEAAAALVTVLLLRGPQAPGELRTRCERLHAFADREAVEAALGDLASRDEPLVHRLARRPGQQDHRWVHLLGPVEQEQAAVLTPTGPDREGVLAGGAELRDARARASYDALAGAYADAFVDELADLPFETWLLDTVAARTVADGGPAVEVGCGPGHVAAHLAAAGVPTTGLDWSPAMVEEARARFPGVDYRVGDLRRLVRPDAAEGWSTVLAWFALVSPAPSELPAAVAALVRPLRPGGLLVLGLLAGTAVRHADEWLGVPVDLDVVEHDPDEVLAVVTAAGLVDVEWYLRGPRADHGETAPRLVVLARTPRPGGAPSTVSP